MTDFPTNILDAQKYAQIEIREGAIAALTQLAKDMGAHEPKINEQSRPGYFAIRVPGINIASDDCTRTLILRSGTSQEKAAAALLREFLDPKTASGEGEAYLEAAGIRYRVQRMPQPLALMA